jgi:hypothetical protein
MEHRVRLGALVGLTLGLLLGCSGTSVDGAGSEASLSARSQQLKLNESGGYGPGPCELGGDQYTFETATGQLAFAYCDYSMLPAAPVTGARALSAPESDSIAQAVDQVRPSSMKNCGADAGVVTLDATTASGVERYADDFYSGCPWDAQAGRTFVTGLPALASLFSQLARANP